MKQYSLLIAVFFCASSQFALASPSPPKHIVPIVPLTWVGVTLGEPEATVLSTTGETGFIIPEPVIGRPMTSISYNIDHGSGLSDVGFHGGRVSSIGIRRSVQDGGAPSVADPHGITLSMTRNDVETKLGKGVVTSANGRDTLTYAAPNGLAWRYSFSGDTMEWIDVEMPDAAIDAMPPAPPFALHAGSSFGDALINGATDERSGAANERDYLLEQHCPTGHWFETEQALVNNGGRPYDVLTLSCANGTTKQLYIDIASFFGKQ